MFRKLYGETDEEQFEYLRKKLKTTLMLSPLILLGIGVIIIFYMWGWDFVRSYIGVTSLFALFSQNPIFGLIILLVFLFIGYLFGFINLLLGIIRYFMLKSTQKGAKS